MAEPARRSDPSGDREQDVRYLPVPATPAPIEAPTPRPLARSHVSAPPATVAAAGGFLAGLATFVIARVLTRRRGSAAGRVLARGGKRGGVEIAGSRSFLVDVHVLRR